MFQAAKVQFVEKLETTTSGEVGKDIRLKVKLSNAGNYQKYQLFFAWLPIFLSPLKSTPNRKFLWNSEVWHLELEQFIIVCVDALYIVTIDTNQISVKIYYYVQSNLAIRNFLVTLELFLNPKSSLSL